MPATPDSTLTVQLALETGPDPYVWSDVSDYVKKADWKIGRDDWLSQVQPGSATLIMKNDDGRFSPLLTTSPLYPHVDSMRSIRIRSSASVYKSYDAEVMADSPLFFGRMGEPSGSVAKDSSGNGRNGTYVNTPTLAQAGALAGDIDMAVLFESASSEYVNGIPAAAWNWGAAGGTVEAWVKVASLLADKCILGDDNAGNTTTWRIRSNSVMDLDIGNFVDGEKAIRNSPLSLTVGVWTHLVVTWHPTNGFVAYQNGAQIDTAATTLATYSSVQPVIGRRSGTTTEYFNGTIDEVAIYNTALSATRIAAHYNAGINTLYGEFQGYIQSPLPDPRKSARTCTIQLTDGSCWLVLDKTTPTYANQRSDLCIGVALDTAIDGAGWPARLRNLASGKSTFTPSYSVTDVLAQCNGIATNEGGLVYFDGWGRLTFEDRQYRLLNTRSTVSNGVFTATTTEPKMRGIIPERATRDIGNEVKVTHSSGVATVTDATSIAKYGRRELPISAAFLSAAEGSDRAYWTLSQRKDPHERPTFDIQGGSSDRLAQILARRISDRITNQETANTGVNGDYWVERVKKVVVIPSIWTADYQLSPVDQASYWILGTAGYSEVGVSTRLGY